MYHNYNNYGPLGKGDTDVCINCKLSRVYSAAFGVQECPTYLVVSGYYPAPTKPVFVRVGGDAVRIPEGTTILSILKHLDYDLNAEIAKRNLLLRNLGAYVVKCPTSRSPVYLSLLEDATQLSKSVDSLREVITIITKQF